MSTIGKTIKIVGDVVGEEDLVIQGRIEGAVQLLSHRFIVDEGASVEGDLDSCECGNQRPVQRAYCCHGKRRAGENRQRSRQYSYPQSGHG